MKDEDLFKTLSNAARQARHDACDAQWEARIELSGDAPRSVDDAEMRAALEQDLLRPLEPERLDRIADSILGASNRESSRQPPASAGRLAPVIPLRRRWLPGLGAAVAGLAAAAGVVFWLGTSSSDLLPAYRLASMSGDVAMRSPATASPEVLRVSKGGRFEIVVRPDQSAQGPLGALTFLLRGNEGTLLPVEADFSPHGPVRVQGVVDDTLPLGPFALAIVIGRPENLGNLAWPVDTAGDDVRVVRVQAVRVE